jgi:F0F1-type ATP synthase assembly protein I
MRKGSQRDPAQAGSLGFTLVALVLVFMGLGYVADRWLHTRPWLMVAGIFVGAGLGFTYMVLILFAGSSGKRGGKKSTDKGEGPE